jgi:hypothetical protein
MIFCRRFYLTFQLVSYNSKNRCVLDHYKKSTRNRLNKIYANPNKRNFDENSILLNLTATFFKDFHG